MVPNEVSHEAIALGYLGGDSSPWSCRLEITREQEIVIYVAYCEI